MKVTKTGTAINAAFATADPETGGQWIDLDVSPAANLSNLSGSGPTYIGPFAGNGGSTTSVDYIRVTPDEVAECPDVDDIVPPVTTATVAPAPNAAGWLNVPASVTLAATDNESPAGEIDTEYRIGTSGNWDPYTAAITVDAQGTSTVQFRSTDAAGNVETAKSVDVKIDSVAPSTNVNQTPSGSGPHVGNVSLTFTAADATSGIAGTSYTVDGGSPQAYAGTPVVLSTVGIHTVTYWSSDNAGNVEGEKSLTVEIADESAPTPGVPPVVEPAVFVTVPNPHTFDLAPGPDYSGPAVDRVMYRISRVELGDTVGWSEFGTPRTIGVDGQYKVQYFYVFADSTTSDMFAIGLDVGGAVTPPVPTGSAKLKLTVSPKKFKLKAKKKNAKLTVKVKNSGDAASNKAKVCISGPAGKIKFKGGKCKNLGKIAVGKTVAKVFRFQPKAKLKGKSAKLTLKVTAPGHKTVKQKIRVKQTKK